MQIFGLGKIAENKWSFNCVKKNPVDGKCGSTKNEGCKEGTLSDMKEATTEYTWKCVGSNGGKTVYCSQNKTCKQYIWAQGGGSQKDCSGYMSQMGTTSLCTAEEHIGKIKEGECSSNNQYGISTSFTYCTCLSYN